MKRVLSLILTILLLISALALPASAAAVSGMEAADTLHALGLMQGTGNGYELERGATRAEALAMLLRLLGKEQAAQSWQGACPFDDGGWAAPLITYAYNNSLVKGVSATHFGAADSVGVRDWLTMLLRALGYDDAAGDFSWEQSIAFADGIGLTHGEYTAADALLREDLAIISCNALTCKLSGSAQTLLDRLYRDGVVSAAAVRATRLNGALSDASGKPVYDGVEIHDNFSPAVFFVDTYPDEAALEKDEPSTSGTGFFITADGVAALCYHELDGVYAVRIRTMDDRRYNVTGVLYYDPLWDVAVVRVGRTDLDGKTVAYFSYLELGDSDAVRAGEKIYLLGNSLGMMDSITDGIISNRRRNVDDPDYLCLQHSAAAASGSSGGPVLNSHGEVVGIQFASFVNGENMNLAVPINVISKVSLTEAGMPIQKVKEIEDEKKAAAVLSADQTELDLQYGDVVKVMVSHNSPGPASIRYEIDGWGVVQCTWGYFVTKHTVPLTIRAVGDGEAEITVSFADENGGEDSDLVIHVTVTGTPEEPEETLPTGEIEYQL